MRHSWKVCAAFLTSALRQSAILTTFQCPKSCNVINSGIKLLTHLKFLKSPSPVPPPPPAFFFFQFWWAYQFCLCLFLSLRLCWSPELRLLTVFHCSLLEEPKARPGFSSASQSLARNAGEMAQLINSAIQLSTRLIHPALGHSWRAMLRRWEAGFLERRMVKMKWNIAPSPASYFI